jgi:hypothetical protein
MLPTVDQANVAGLLAGGRSGIRRASLPGQAAEARGSYQSWVLLPPSSALLGLSTKSWQGVEAGRRAPAERRASAALLTRWPAYGLHRDAHFLTRISLCLRSRTCAREISRDSITPHATSTP